MIESAQADQASTDRARSDLAFLRQVISDARRRLAVDASPFVVWGVAVVAGVGFEYAARGFGLAVPMVWVWLAIVVAAWLVSLLLWRRHRRQVGAASLVDRVLGALWTGCWGTMCVVGFGGFFAGHLQGPGIVGSLAAVLGAGYYATGVLIDHPPVRRLALAWWATALAVYFLPFEVGQAVFGLAMLVLQVIPALYLRRRWMKPEPDPGHG